MFEKFRLFLRKPGLLAVQVRLKCHHKVLMRHLWQIETIVFLHGRLIHAVLLDRHSVWSALIRDCKKSLFLLNVSTKCLSDNCFSTKRHGALEP
jgi:hypothetical protein